ncbi:MAG TPA: hypothetical protein VJ583_00730 [Nitrososphaeraceae archaeon]|nr:hypothetical protein [Nitrososphaeraceae archaeon]
MNIDSKRIKPMTFRIENKILEKIREEGEKDQISVSNLINKILKRYVEWDLYTSKVGMIPIPRLLLEKLFEKRSEQEIIELATNVGKNELEDILLFMNKKIDWILFLNWFKIRLQNSSIEIMYTIEKNKHTFIMKHGMGENWSLYHKTIFELISKENYKNPVDIKYNSRIISIEFYE